MAATGPGDRRLILQVERDLLALARLKTLSSAARRTLTGHQLQLRNLQPDVPAVIRRRPVAQRGTFNVRTYLASAGLAKTVGSYSAGDVIFSQGGPSNTVLYIQSGGVHLSVRAEAREVIFALLEPGDFFGEGCLAGQRRRTATATAITASVIVLIDKDQMLKVLAEQPAMSIRFIGNMLSRNLRIEENFVDRLLNSSERRLARTLWLLAGSRKGVVPHMPQATLAKIVGTTRGRVNFFLKKFQRLGLIDHTDGLTVHESLLTFLHE